MTTPRTVIGVDAGTTSLRDADHLVHDLTAELALPEDAYACTHPIRSGRPHLALSFALPDETTAMGVWRCLTPRTPPLGLFFRGDTYGPGGLSEGAARAAAEHGARTAGRAVRYPGSASLPETVTVAELLSATAIDEVTVLGSPAPPPDSAQSLHTRGHVRPEWRAGRLVLTVMPAAGGVLTPFEFPDPTPCCAGHSP